MEGLGAAVFPSSCRFCRAVLIKISPVPVCEDCLAALSPLNQSVCKLCGQHPVSPSAADACCSECLREPPPFTRAVAYGSYDGVLRQLIHLLKYQRVRPVAEVLGRCLAESIGNILPEFGPEAPLVVVVPLHASKMRQRGFNQSELIAREAVAKLPRRIQVSGSVLVRRWATESQTGLSRAQRKLNVKGAFALARTHAIAGRDILLVDDVLTTGATASECARLLKRAGCCRVWVATVANVTVMHAADAGPQEGATEFIAATRAHAAGGF